MKMGFRQSFYRLGRRKSGFELEKIKRFQSPVSFAGFFRWEIRGTSNTRRKLIRWRTLTRKMKVSMGGVFKILGEFANEKNILPSQNRPDAIIPTRSL